MSRSGPAYNLEEAAQRYADGLSQQAVADEFGISKGRLTRDMKRGGYKLRAGGGGKKHEKSLELEPWNLLVWRIVERSLMDWHNLNGRRVSPRLEGTPYWPTLAGGSRKASRRSVLRRFFHSDWFEVLCEGLSGKPSAAFLRKKHRIP